MQEQSFDFILGIDIGSTKVSAVVTRQFKKNGADTLEVIGIGKSECEGVNKGNITNLHRTKEAIQNALDDATRQAGFSRKDFERLLANVNVGGTYLETKREFNTINRKSTGDDVKGEDMNALFYDVQQARIPDGAEIVHVLPLTFSVDEEQNIYDPVGHIGRKLSGDFQLITARKSVLNNIKNSLQTAQSSLREDQIVVSPLASGLSVLDEKQKKIGVAVVDIGGGTTDVAIYHKGILQHIAILPFAGRHITSDIEDGCHLDWDSAEEAKLLLSNTDPNDCQNNMLLVVPTADGIPPVEIVAKNVVLIIQARLREIAAMVFAEIKRAGYDKKLHAGIVLTGGTSMMKNIEKTFSEITEMHVQKGMPKGLETTALYKEVAIDPSLSTALGLAWSSLKPLDGRLNPRIIQQEAKANIQKQSEIKKWNFMPNFATLKSQLNGIWNDNLGDQYESTEQKYS